MPSATPGSGAGAQARVGGVTCVDGGGLLQRGQAAEPVSYTHLDVYKRQALEFALELQVQLTAFGNELTAHKVAFFGFA